MAKETLRLAIPSKGRLADPVAAFFRAAGAAIKFGGARDYRASLPAIPAITVQLMAAAEIAEALRAGDVHAGVTGEDLMHETLGGAPGDVPDAPICARRLGFGGARLVVAVPRAWIDVATMDDLAAAARQFRARHRRPLRVATKYVRLVRGFFARAGVVDYRIVGSTGATEAAPAAGLADLIADITSSGETLAANHLKILDGGMILDSQASLYVARRAGGGWRKEQRAALKHLLDLMDARALGAGRMRLSALIPKAANAKRLREGLAALGCDDIQIVQGALSAHCADGAIYRAAQFLQDAGAETVDTEALAFVFREKDSTYAALGPLLR